MSKNKSAIVPFRFESQDVRTVKDDNGNPWFVAKDVCDILEIKNTSDALSKIPDKHKGIDSTDTLGGVQNMSVIYEPGLYRLILRSDKPKAEPFMEWVTSEVLPAIRKTGGYSMPGIVPESGSKRCTRCKQFKPLSEFTKYARMKDGLHYYCKDCVRLIQMGIKNVYVGDAPQIHNEEGSIDNEKLNKLYLKALSFVTDCHNVFRKTTS